jgi:hypothetical protein
MKRLGPALVGLVFLIVAAQSLPAGEDPDLRQPGIQALRREYEASRAALVAKRLKELRAMLTHHLEEQQRKQRQAKLSGNTTRYADASQGVRLFETALDTLKREDTFAFPAKVRPALERIVALCTRTLQSENAARDDGFKLLDTQFAGRLQPLLARQGITADPGDLQVQWQTVLKAGEAETQAVSNEQARSVASHPSGAATNEVVLDVRGEAAAWIPLARIGIEVSTLEVIALPVAGVTERVGRKGTGLESGAPWQAAVTPFRTFNAPADGQAPAMRIRALTGMLPLDVVAWPSRRNDWKIELRVRPPNRGASRHGCVLEIDAVAVDK